MAKNKKITKNDSCREKIQTSQLINRLQDGAMGKIELTTNQLAAIKILLSKTLPDLTSVENTGEGGGPMKLEVTVKLV